MRKLHVLVLATALVAVPGVVSAAPPTKDECVEAHSRGQDLRDKGQLARGRAMFLVCANPVCPSLVQADCARYGDELERLVPSLTFSARDASGADLPNTQVYVDGAQVAARLDEGKAFDLDPGKHTVRFVHDGKEVTQTVVVSQGEKARSIVAQFGEPKSAGGGTSTPAQPVTTEHRPVFPLVLAGVGAAALGTGIALAVVGMGKVPDQCSTSTHQCAAAPGSSVFDDASSGVKLANVGVGTAIGGGVVMIGGLVWYFVQPTETRTTAGKGVQVTPWASTNGGGLGAFGAF